MAKLSVSLTNLQKPKCQAILNMYLLGEYSYDRLHCCFTFSKLTLSQIHRYNIKRACSKVCIFNRPCCFLESQASFAMSISKRVCTLFMTRENSENVYPASKRNHAGQVGSTLTFNLVRRVNGPKELRTHLM